MYLNGNLKFVIAGISLLLTIGGAAVGYGSLKQDVSTNTLRISELRMELTEAKNSPTGSSAGAVLQGEINEINHRLDRIEAKQDQIIILLTPKR